MLPIEESRLLDAVKRVLGSQVTRLRMPPIKPDDKVDRFSPEAQNRRSRAAISTLAPLRAMRNVGGVRLRAYSRSKKISIAPRIPTSSTRCARRAKIPMPFPPVSSSACRSGHLDDFPWRWFVHEGQSDCKGTLLFFEQGASLQTENLWVKCDGCDAARSLVHAFGREAEANLPACRGRHPHLSTYDDSCEERPRAVLLGSTNSWFSISLSVLAIPQGKNQLAQLIEDGWTYFADAESEDEVKVILKTSH